MRPLTLAELAPDFGPGSHGDPVLWGRMVSPFTSLARAQSLAVILLDQSRKSDGKYAGSAAKAGSVDVLVEMEAKDGGLEATPRGRVPLPPFRVELDAEGIPRFSGNATAPQALTPTNEKSHRLLQLLAEAEPEGLTSAGWMKLSGFPKETFNRNRRALITAGLVLSPAETRTRHYRVTDRGERVALVPEVPHGTTGTVVPLGGSGTTVPNSMKYCLVPGTPQAPSPENGRLQLLVPNAEGSPA